MWRGSALIVLAGTLSCGPRPDGQASGEAQASRDSQTVDVAQATGAERRGEAANLEGTWRVVGAWVHGKPSAINVTGRTWTFHDSTLATANKGKVDQRGTVKIDSTSSPPRLDFFLNRGSGTGTLVRRQIYQLANDTLTVAYALEHSAQSHPRNLDVTEGVVKLKLVRSQ